MDENATLTDPVFKRDRRDERQAHSPAYINQKTVHRQIVSSKNRTVSEKESVDLTCEVLLVRLSIKQMNWHIQFTLLRRNVAIATL